MRSSKQHPGALPASVAATVGSRLAGSPDEELFTLRLQRWWPDLHDGLASVYGAQAEDTAVRLLELAADAYAVRDPELQRLRPGRTLEPDWFQRRGCWATPPTPTGSPATLAGVAEHGRLPARAGRHATCT